MPFVTAYLSANINQRVPTMLYCATLFVAALLNIKVNRTVVGGRTVYPKPQS